MMTGDAPLDSSLTPRTKECRRPATRRVRKPVTVPAGFPVPNCMGGTPLFKAAFGGVPRTTWASWRKSGKIPKPDLKIGALDFWWQENMHRTLIGASPFDLSSAEAVKTDANETAAA